MNHFVACENVAEFVEAFSPTEAQGAASVGINLILPVAIVDRDGLKPIPLIDRSLPDHIRSWDRCYLGVGVWSLPLINPPSKWI